MLNLVVRKVTARLYKVNNYCYCLSVYHLASTAHYWEHNALNIGEPQIRNDLGENKYGLPEILPLNFMAVADKNHKTLQHSQRPVRAPPEYKSQTLQIHAPHRVQNRYIR
jgi:hypothetical protein